MKNKKGLMASTLVVVIIMLVVFVILLKLDLHILALLRAVSEGGVCAWSAVFSSFGNVGGVETFKIVCPQRYVSLVMTQKEAEDKQKETKIEEYFAIDKPIPNSLRKKLDKWYKTGYDFTDKTIYREYRMNEVMAKEMKNCWSKLGRGELNLFSSWFKKIPFGYVDDENELRSRLRYFQFWDIKPKASQKACIICSRIRFSEEVKNEFGDKTITTSGEWMRNHPVNVLSPKPLSYYEFLLDETIPSDFFARDADKERLYYTTNKDQAIVFMRINIHALIETGSDILDIFPGFGEEDHIQAIDAVFITPYDEVEDRCDIIVN